MTESPKSEIPTASSPTSLLKQLQQDFKVMGEFLPLAIGIDKELMALRPEINRKHLRAALGIHTHSVRYLKTMQAGTQRYDLHGVPAGEVTEEHRSLASKALFERFKKRTEEHKAVQVEKERAEKEVRIERERLEKLNQLVGKFSRNS